MGPIRPMKSNVYRLLPDRPRIKRQEAEGAAHFLRALGLPRHLQQQIEHALYRSVEPDSLRSPFGNYVMLSVQQIGAIWDALRKLPPEKRPQEVRHLFDLCILNLRQDTGEILLNRQQLAERMECRPDRVSTAMGILQRLGIVIKGERIKVPGLRGPGLATYFVNPHAAWNGSLEIQKITAKRQQPPLLRLMNGGKDDE